MNTLNEIISIHAERATTYGLLARLLASEVDEKLLTELSKVDFTNMPDSYRSGFLKIQAYLESADDSVLTELAVDFAHLFIIRETKKYHYPYPYESVYKSDKNVKMADSRDQVLDVYRKYALKIDDRWKDTEDHVAIELEFMKHLSLLLLDALESKNKTQCTQLLKEQISFLENHIMTWVPLFTEIMEDYAKTKFYSGVAQATREFIEYDSTVLSDSVN